MASLDGEEGEQEAAAVVDRKELLAQQFDAEAEEQAHGPDEKFPLHPNEERPRAPDGKFTQKAQEPEAVPTPAEQEPLWKRPPASWKKETHDLWKSADPRLQEYAFAREEQMRAGVEPLLPKAQLADKISKAAEPYMNTIQGMGIDLPTAVEGLMKADHDLRTLPFQQKVQRLVGLARNYGIDLAAMLGQGSPQGQQQAQPDQNYYALQNELNNVRGEIVSFKQAQEQQAEQAALGDINRFAQTADYFEEARPTMVSLLQNGLAGTLEEAYEKAIRLDTQLFETVQGRKQAESASASVSAKNMAAKSARAAAVSVKGSTPGTKTPTKAQDRRSMLAEQFDGMSERL